MLREEKALRKRNQILNYTYYSWRENKSEKSCDTVPLNCYKIMSMLNCSNTNKIISSAKHKTV